MKSLLPSNSTHFQVQWSQGFLRHFKRKDDDKEEGRKKGELKTAEQWNCCKREKKI